MDLTRPWDTTPDIVTAMAWLNQQGFANAAIGIVGASYGANNALTYASRTPTIPAVALLSPGTNYHGLAIEPVARVYHGAVLIVTGKSDPITEGGPELIVRVAPSPPETLTLDGSAHGTDLCANAKGAGTRSRSFFMRSLGGTRAP